MKLFIGIITFLLHCGIASSENLCVDPYKIRKSTCYSTISAALTDAVAGDVIVLYSGSYNSINDTGLVVSVPNLSIISLKGPLNTIINLSNFPGRWFLQVNSNFTLVGITVRGYSGLKGSVVFEGNDIHVVVDNSIFRDSSFEGSPCGSCGNANGTAGLVHLSNGSLIISNSRFQNLTHPCCGNAAALNVLLDARVFLKNCTFSDNISVGNQLSSFYAAFLNGVATYFGGGAIVSVENCFFYNNTGVGDESAGVAANGVAIFAGTAAALNISGCRFIDNVVCDSNPQYGSLIYPPVSNTNTYIENCIFSTNDEGCPINRGYANVDPEPMVILTAPMSLRFQNCVFQNINTSSQAVLSVSSGAMAEFNNCEFVSNHISASYSFILVNGGSIKIIRSRFVNNTIENSPLLNIAAGISELDGCEFAYNTVTNTSLVAIASGTISNCTWIENHLNPNKLIIASPLQLFGVAPIFVFNSTFLNNLNAAAGGAITVSQTPQAYDPVQIDGCVFNGNFVKETAPAILITSGFAVFRRDSFANNTASDLGGYQGAVAVGFHNYYASFCFSNATASMISQGQQAGALFFEDSLFDNNQPIADGAQIIANANGTSMTTIPINITIISFDYCNRSLSQGGSRKWFSGSAIGPTKTVAQIEDKENGSYVAVFNLTIVGVYHLTIFFGGATGRVNGTVHSTWTIIPGPISPINTLLYGPGLTGAVAALEGTMVEFWIQLRDEYGNNYTSSAVNLSISICNSTSSGIISTSEYAGNGLYVIRYLAYPGYYFITITIDNILVANITSFYSILPTLYAAPNGNQNSPCNDSATPCDIETAISLASIFSTAVEILLLPGPYDVSQLNVTGNQSLHLRPFMPAQVVLDSQGREGPVISLIGGGPLFISNITFRNSTSSTLVTAKGSSLHLQSCVFSQISHNSRGTGCAAINASGLITIENSLFQQNSVSGDVNEEYFFGFVCVASNAWILNTTFTKNSIFVTSRTTVLGSALFIAGEAEVKNCVFTNNNIHSVANPAYGGAVAISLHGLNVNFFDCSFDNNSIVISGNSTISSAGGGAVIIVDSSAKTNPALVTMFSCIFQKNFVVWRTQGSTPIFGGALYFNSLSSISMGNCSFEENFLVASYGVPGGAAFGGAIAANFQEPTMGSSLKTSSQSRFMMDTSTVTNNSIYGGDSGCDKSGGEAKGGGIWISLKTGIATLKKVVLQSNTAIGGNSSCSNERNGWKTYSASGSETTGGGLHIDGTPQSLLVLAITEFTDNIAVLGRSVNDSVLNTDALSSSLGGALYASSNLTLNGCIFHNNLADASAYGSGASGAIYALSQLTVQNSTFTANSVTGIKCIGGAISSLLGGISITNVTFDGNSLQCSSLGGGGAVALGSNQPLSWIYNTSFIGNSAANFVEKNHASVGGALYCDSLATSLIMNECLFANNTASFGGAVYAKNFNTTNRLLESCSFRSNSATVAGGALFIASPVAIIANTTSIFLDNAAPYGRDLAAELAQLVPLVEQGYPVYPGQHFLISLELLDKVGNRANRTDITVYIYTADASFSSDAPRNQVSVLPETATYNFTSTILNSVIPNTSINITAITLPQQLYSFVTEFSISVVQCPPTLQLDLSTGNCIPCVNDQYILDAEDGGKCLQCPHTTNSPSHYSCVGPLQQSGPQSYNIEIEQGYWPSPTLNQPINLLECPIPDVCKPFLCIVALNATQWQLSCANSICNDSNEGDFPYIGCCNSDMGYYDRLCSRCLCNDTICYYSVGGSKCVPCSEYQIAVTITWLVVLIISIACFAMMPEVSVVLFSIELIVSSVLFLLGWANVTQVSLVLLLLLLGLVGSDKIPRGLVGTFVFFTQSLVVIPVDAWPKSISSQFRSIWDFRSLPTVCIAPSLFESPITELIVELVLPVVFIIFVLILMVLAYFLNRIPFVVGWRASLSNWLSKGRKMIRSKHDDVEQPLLSDEERMDLQLKSINRFDMDTDEVVQQLDPENPQVLSVSGPFNHRTFLLHMARAVLFLVEYFFFNITSTVLQILQPCQNGYMAEMLWVPCKFSNNDYLWLIIIASITLMVFTLGFFAIIAAILYSKRKLILENDETTKYCFGGLYKHFQPNLFWFGLVLLGRRLLLAIATSLIPADNALQPSLAAGIFLLSAILFGSLNPFKSGLENIMDMIASCSLAWAYAEGWMAEIELADYIAVQYITFIANIILLLVLLVLMVSPHVWGAAPWLRDLLVRKGILPTHLAKNKMKRKNQDEQKQGAKVDILESSLWKTDVETTLIQSNTINEKIDHIGDSLRSRNTRGISRRNSL